LSLPSVSEVTKQHNARFAKIVSTRLPLTKKKQPKKNTVGKTPKNILEFFDKGQTFAGLVLFYHPSVGVASSTFPGSWLLTARFTMKTHPKLGEVSALCGS